jgi:hypothetical protein
MSKSIGEYSQIRREVPCVDDAGNPPENPESNIYPDICSIVRVRTRIVPLNENDSLPALHLPTSENDLE